MEDSETRLLASDFWIKSYCMRQKIIRRVLVLALLSIILGYKFKLDPLLVIVSGQHGATQLMKSWDGYTLDLSSLTLLMNLLRKTRSVDAYISSFFSEHKEQQICSAHLLHCYSHAASPYSLWLITIFISWGDHTVHLTWGKACRLTPWMWFHWSAAQGTGFSHTQDTGIL